MNYLMNVIKGRKLYLMCQIAHDYIQLGYVSLSYNKLHKLLTLKIV